MASWLSTSSSAARVANPSVWQQIDEDVWYLFVGDAVDDEAVSCTFTVDPMLYVVRRVIDSSDEGRRHEESHVKI